ncbi:hypothetical protein AAL_02439 [Moelleriella libera RCEF 2490]|uniref:Major facilitator superfamily domain, general substrate transporter n=1 Tax=Moelleriella libera RCEF 2490 TaxID=1081109 RepID=A0A168EKA6_9HYPO|nr:hypothetical protein AAL_02439 [Moelleriella libera RCEF 2490]
MVAFGGIIINGLVVKSGVAPIYLMWLSLVVQLAGVAPLAYVPIELAIHGEIHAFEILIGFGIGATSGICTIMPSRVLSQVLYKATATGALSQSWVVGAAVGVAIENSITNSNIDKYLSDTLSSQQLGLLRQSPGDALRVLPSDLQDLVLFTFGGSYKYQAFVFLSLTCVQFFVVAKLWKKADYEGVESEWSMVL